MCILLSEDLVKHKNFNRKMRCRLRPWVNSFFMAIEDVFLLAV